MREWILQNIVTIFTTILGGSSLAAYFFERKKIEHWLHKYWSISLKLCNIKVTHTNDYANYYDKNYLNDKIFLLQFMNIAEGNIKTEL